MIRELLLSLPLVVSFVGTADPAIITPRAFTNLPEGSPVRRFAEITITGPIEPGDARKFAMALAIINDNGEIPYAVNISSPGGAAADALDIGHVIRAHKMVTVVAKGSECASACAFIWAAGYIRVTLEPIGLHTAYNRNTLLPSDPGTLALLRDYWQKMDMPGYLFDLSTRYGATDMYWLRVDEATGLMYSTAAGQMIDAACGNNVDWDCILTTAAVAQTGEVVVPATAEPEQPRVSRAAKAKHKSKRSRSPGARYDRKFDSDPTW